MGAVVLGHSPREAKKARALVTAYAGTLPSIIRSMSVATFPPDLSTQPLVAALLDQGVVVVEDVIGKAVLPALRGETGRLVSSEPFGSNGFDGYRTRRVFDPFRRTRALDEIVLRPLLHDVLQRVLTWPYQFGMTILSQIYPGEVAQPSHRDAAVYPLPQDFPEVMVNTIWALDDFTAENGATMVAPGSHRDAGIKDLVPVVMAAGSVMIYSGRLRHGAGANGSDTTRLGFIVEHVVRWLRPADCHPLAVGPEIAATLEPQLQELLGFNQTSEYFGFVNGRPPAEWLAAATAT